MWKMMGTLNFLIVRANGFGMRAKKEWRRKVYLA